jgi:hypothetical protein
VLMGHTRELKRVKVTVSFQYVGQKLAIDVGHLALGD